MKVDESVAVRVIPEVEFPHVQVRVAVLGSLPPALLQAGVFVAGNNELVAPEARSPTVTPVPNTVLLSLIEQFTTGDVPVFLAWYLTLMFCSLRALHPFVPSSFADSNP